jgi:hypothetical protein
MRRHTCEHGTILVVAVVLLVAAAAIVGGVIAVAMGMGGAMAPTVADVVPPTAGPLTAADVAAVRPQTALWGYDMQVTDELLNQAAEAIADRDMQIASLRQRLALAESGGTGRSDPGSGLAGPGLGARMPDSAALRPPGSPPAMDAVPSAGGLAPQGWPRPSALRREFARGAATQPWAVWDSPGSRPVPPAEPAGPGGPARGGSSGAVEGTGTGPHPPDSGRDAPGGPGGGQ